MLVYCVFLAESHPPRPATGVAGLPVEELEANGLRFWISDVSREAADRFDTRVEGLAFHKIIDAAFAATAVIPFRYPGVLDSLDELRARHDGFLRELQRLRDLVQMEARIVPTARGEAATGTAYLRARQAALHAVAAAADAARLAAAELTREWRQKGTRTGIRCFALVPRTAIAAFRARLAEAPFTPAVSVRVSGPWPPTEFLDLPNLAPSDKV